MNSAIVAILRFVNGLLVFLCAMIGLGGFALILAGHLILPQEVRNMVVFGGTFVLAVAWLLGWLAFAMPFMVFAVLIDIPTKLAEIRDALHHRTSLGQGVAARQTMPQPSRDDSRWRPR